MAGGVVFKDNNGPVSIASDRRIARASILGKLIEIIATSEPDPVDLTREPSETERKMVFNNLNTHLWIIKKYIENALLVDGSITQLNRMINGGSTKLKRQMNMFYCKALAEYKIFKFPEDLEKLRLHSDNIVAKVLIFVEDLVRSSSDLQDGFYDEDIEFGVMLVTSYSIIECIVLENPNDHN